VGFWGLFPVDSGIRELRIFSRKSGEGKILKGVEDAAPPVTEETWDDRHYCCDFDVRRKIENEIGIACLMRELLGIAVGSPGWFGRGGIGWVFKVRRGYSRTFRGKRFNELSRKVQHFLGFNHTKTFSDGSIFGPN
jgi:hypothetical protein